MTETPTRAAAPATTRPAARSGAVAGALLARLAVLGVILGAFLAIGRRLARMPNPLAGGMAKYYAFRVAAAIVPRLPAKLVYGGASLAGALFWLAAPRLRARAERNLRHIPRLAADPPALKRAVRGVFGYLILNYLDFLRDGSLSDEQIRAACHVENEETFRRMVAEGRGMVLLVPHSSAFELAAAWLAVMGFHVVIPVERMQPEQLFAFFRRTRERHGVRFLPADSRATLHEMIQTLRSGGVLVFAVDRLVSGASVELPFFGALAKMPTTPAALAVRLGARVGAAFPYRRTPEHGEILFVPLPTDETTTDVADKTGDKNEAGARLQRRFLAELERFLTEHPEQWGSALAPVWEV